MIDQTTAQYRATFALLPHLRVWEGTRIVDPRSTPSIRHAVSEFASAHSIPDVQVLQPGKHKAHFTITQMSCASARDYYDQALDWTTNSGEIALLTELSWLADTSYPLGISDVYVVSASAWPTKTAMAWFVFGRLRQGRWWVL